MPYMVVPDVTKVLTEDPVKMLFIDLDDKSHLERFREHMKPYCDEHGIDMFFSNDYYLEFLPHGINKGSGVRYLSQLLEVPISNTFAAGDAENDITMLREADIGYAVKGSGLKVRAAADRMTVSVIENAIAYVIEDIENELRTAPGSFWHEVIRP
jgi:hydroxymethylpyrimidine pyrophosphatase-like HAD family hydrolase